MRITRMFSLSVLVLSACAQAPAQRENPLAVKAQPAWAATHYKVGARLYPRCMDIVSTGSKLSKTRYCMTDAEIASLEDYSQSIKVDLQQRVPAITSNVPGQ